MKRYAYFLIPFAVCVSISYAINYYLGSVVAGLGFYIAYCYGEGSGSNEV